MRAVELTLGALAATAIFAGFYSALSTPPPDDLLVRLDGSRAHVLASPRPKEEIMLGPDGLRDRIEDDDSAGLSAIGLRTYRVVYGGRWEREVTVPVVHSPVMPEGKPWPCSARVRLLPSFFDNGTDDGGDALAIVEREIRKQFPRDIVAADIKVMHFAEVRSTDLKIALEPGQLVIRGTITLDDDDRKPTRFTITGKVSLGEKEGDIVVNLDDLALDWTGKTRDKLLVEIADIFVDVEKIAQAEVKRQIGKVLPFIKLPRDPIQLGDLVVKGARGISGTLRPRLCDRPEITAAGVSVGIGVTAELDEPHKDPGIMGPPAVPGKQAPLVFGAAAVPAAAHNVEAVASLDALEQALYLLWQGGALDAWGKSEGVLENFQEKMADRVALKLDALDVRLPPVTLALGAADCAGFGIRFADLAVGTMVDGRTAVVHADFCSIPSVVDGRLRLESRILSFAMNCSKEVRDEVWLTPCLSDVIPVLRDEDLSKYAMPLTLPIPDRLLHISLVKGASIELSDLRANAKDGLLRMQAQVKVDPGDE
ncbi:MAG: hypothetical protein U0271_39020 [Polyangiaceae bacterium]